MSTRVLSPTRQGSHVSQVTAPLGRIDLSTIPQRVSAGFHAPHPLHSKPGCVGTPTNPFPTPFIALSPPHPPVAPKRQQLKITRALAAAIHLPSRLTPARGSSSTCLSAPAAPELHRVVAAWARLRRRGRGRPLILIGAWTTGGSPAAGARVRLPISPGALLATLPCAPGRPTRLFRRGFCFSADMFPRCSRWRAHGKASTSALPPGSPR